MSLSTFAAAQILRALPRVRISRAVGRLCERDLPKRVADPLLRAYCRAYRVNLEEAEEASAGYPNFNAFFTRPLRQGVRRLSNDALVSPSDGLLSAAGRVDSGARLFVKGQHYEVGELIGDLNDAARYSGGQFAVVYLAPGDYHRVHSPAVGRVSLVRGIAGDLYPVNRIGERHVPRLFVRNSRAVIPIDTAELGRITVVMVGAVIVGRITVTGLNFPDVPPGEHTFDPAREVQPGDEIGIFHLGSTVVVLTEPGLSIARPLGRIRYGESLLRVE
ncbi:MAG TPA: archaetidylserine decarboxylase [Polyangiaceae bacterium]|nr:archaetidylserine decarboxylase [Polyangiaceae bacterium]